MNITSTAAATALLSPEGIVLAGYVLAVLIRQYVSDRDVFDFDAELLGTDIDVDIDPDHGIPILREFTFTEQVVILLSLYTSTPSSRRRPGCSRCWPARARSSCSESSWITS